jgi:hypothetical protein
LHAEDRHLKEMLQLILNVLPILEKKEICCEEQAMFSVCGGQEVVVKQSQM